MSQKQELLTFLSQYITPERKDSFERVLANRTRHFTIAIEDLHKEKNSSAIMRTCECFGIQDVHVIEDDNYLKPSPLISAGASNWLDIFHYNEFEDNALASINHLKSEGYQIVATHPDPKNIALQNFDISQKSVFFLGDELDGLSDTVLNHADVFLTIPMLGFTKSYNVSVSGGIILQEVIPALHTSKIDWQLTEDEKLDLRIKWSIKSIKKGQELVRYFQNHILKNQT